MSKEDKHIDNLFKEKLEGRSFDGPPADFLADLNQRLDAKPVVSKSWIGIIFLNLFIIGLFIANASIDFSTPKTAEVKSQIDNKEQRSSKEESFKTKNRPNKTTSVKESDVQTDHSTINESSNNTDLKSKEFENNQVEQSSNESTEANRDENNQVKNNSAELNTQGYTVRKSESTKNKNSEDSNAKSFSVNKKTSNASTKTRNKVSSQATKKGDGTGLSQNVKSAVRANTTEANKDKSETKKTTSNKEDLLISGAESLSPYVNYNAIYATQFDEVDRKITTNDFPEFPTRWNELVAKNDNKSSDKTNKKEKDSETRRFEIQLAGGATQWNFKTLGTNDNYVNQIDQSGTPKWTPNFGIGFNVNFNNISIGMGVDYAKFKTENLFEFTEINTYDSTYIGGYNANVTYDSLGNPIDTTYTPYYDSTTVTDTSINVMPITNQYEWIQIPIHFGYRFNLNKWAIIPRVGMNIGLGIRQSSGEYPNETYDNLQTIDPVKWHLNLHTSLEVRRDFGHWHAFGKFNYQRNLTPTIDNALFERKYNGLGFSFGVGYSF